MVTNAAKAGIYRHWLPGEDEQLRKLRDAGLSREDIATLMGRSFKAVKHRLCR